MTCNKGKLKIVSGITASLLLCTLLSPLRAQDDTRRREELVKACQEKVEKVKEQEKESIEHIIIAELFGMVEEDTWVYTRNVHERLKEKPEWDWINVRTVGKVLKRLNFKMRHKTQGSTYFVTKKQLKELSRRYGVDIGE